jgi:hypothetical protein
MGRWRTANPLWHTFELRHGGAFIARGRHTDGHAAGHALPVTPFAHPVEREIARIFDEHGIK